MDKKDWPPCVENEADLLLYDRNKEKEKYYIGDGDRYEAMLHNNIIYSMFDIRHQMDDILVDDKASLNNRDMLGKLHQNADMLMDAIDSKVRFIENESKRKSKK